MQRNPKSQVMQNQLMDFSLIIQYLWNIGIGWNRLEKCDDLQKAHSRANGVFLYSLTYRWEKNAKNLRKS